MKIKLVGTKYQSYFRALCRHCGRVLNSRIDEIFADSDGEPFLDYYCRSCVQEIEAGFIQQEGKRK